MPTSFRASSVIIAIVLFLFPAIGLAQQPSIVLGAVKDNTLYEHEGGLLSNGIGNYLFAGKTGNGAIRRAVIAFDVAGNLPNNVAIDSVHFSLSVSRTIAPASIISLHRLEANWGESVSNAEANEGQGAQAVNGDATWLHTSFSDAFWTNPGGDFDDTESASRLVGADATYIWYSTERLTDDVRDWNEHPERNFGWLIKGDESANSTAKRFDSRETLAPTSPYLRVYYSISTATESDILPVESRLFTGFPNPFQDKTTIRYELGTADHVALDIYDALGRRVKSLVSEWQPAGRHEVMFTAGSLGNGLYLVRMSTRESVRTGKIVLMR